MSPFLTETIAICILLQLFLCYLQNMATVMTSLDIYYPEVLATALYLLAAKQFNSHSSHSLFPVFHLGKAGEAKHQSSRRAANILACCFHGRELCAKSVLYERTMMMTMAMDSLTTT